MIMPARYIIGLCLFLMLSQHTIAEVMTADKANIRLQHLSQEIFKSPQDTRLLLQRGDIYFQLHEFEKAVHDYSVALSIKPKLAEAYFGRGMALGRLGNVREGIADLSIFLERRPDSSIGYTKRGVRYLWIGDRDNAAKDFHKAIALNPQNAEAHDDLGVIYAQKGELKTALSHFKQTITHDPEYQKGYHNLALGYFLSEDASSALTYVNQAIQLQPNNRNSLMLKAEILLALGKKNEALLIREEAEYLPEGNWSEQAPTPENNK